MENRYGQLPEDLGKFNINVEEMFFYQDMLIKDIRYSTIMIEERLWIFNDLIEHVISDYIKEFGIESYINTYMYVSAKHLFQPVREPFNRPGWHCDGYMTDDINYIWSNTSPTIFNYSEFNLTQHHAISIQEMEEQAREENNISYPDNTLIKINQFNVHKVADVEKAGMRAFVKITFSKDKYDLKGNTKNYLLDYNWNFRDRNMDRNVPQIK